MPLWMQMDGKLHSHRSLFSSRALLTDFTKMTICTKGDLSSAACWKAQAKQNLAWLWIVPLVKSGVTTLCLESRFTRRLKHQNIFKSILLNLFCPLFGTAKYSQHKSIPDWSPSSRVSRSASCSSHLHSAWCSAVPDHAGWAWSHHPQKSPWAAKHMCEKLPPACHASCLTSLWNCRTWLEMTGDKHLLEGQTMSNEALNPKAGMLQGKLVYKDAWGLSLWLRPTSFTTPFWGHTGKAITSQKRQWVNYLMHLIWLSELHCKTWETAGQLSSISIITVWRLGQGSADFTDRNSGVSRVCANSCQPMTLPSCNWWHIGREEDCGRVTWFCDPDWLVSQFQVMTGFEIRCSSDLGWLLRDLGAYIVHELFADRANFWAECGTEHHHLLLMWGQFEDCLNIWAHVCRYKACQ